VQPYPRCYHPRMDIALVLILILVVVIIWRGPKTLPLLGKAFGQGVKEARKEIAELKAEDEDRDADKPAT
jgi:Sec-independent protein translocase protein TatA